MNPIVAGSLISAGSSLLGGLIDRPKGSSWSVWDRFQQRKWNETSQRNFENQISIRAADAKRAGVHPLFALGASSGSSPSFNTGVGYDHETGSGIGTGIARAGAAIGEGVSRMSTKESALRRGAETRLLGAQAAKAEADAALAWTEAMAADSAMKRAEQSTNWKRLAHVDVREGGARGSIGRRQGADVVPEKLWLRDPFTGEYTKGLNPDAGLDEVGQAYWVGQKASQMAKDFLLDVFDRGKWVKRRPTGATGATGGGGW